MKGFLKKILIQIKLYSVILFVLHYYFVIKRLFKLHSNYKENIRVYNTFKHIANPSSLNILFDLNNAEIILNVFPLMHFFSKKGYNIWIKKNYRFISLLGFGTSPILKHESIQISKIENKKQIFYIAFFDQDRNYLTKKYNTLSCIQLKQIKNSYYKNSEGMYFPYPFNPEIYYRNFYENISTYRNNKTKFKVFFSGNINKVAYTKYNLEKDYSILNRHTIISELFNSCLASEIKNITKLIELETILKDTGSTNKIVCILTDWNQHQENNLDIKIPLRNWLKVLSVSDFFLACPGVQIPFSHNVIEAMSVGAIPIIQYGHLFNPPLEHLINCISFNSMDDLVKQIELILQMPKIKIEELRKNVISYYDSFLDLNTFTNQLTQNPSDYKNLYLYTEFFKLWKH